MSTSTSKVKSANNMLPVEKSEPGIDFTPIVNAIHGLTNMYRQSWGQNKPKMTARQETINMMLNGARNEVIYNELQRDFLKALKEKIAKGEMDGGLVSLMFNGPIDAVIDQYEAGYQVSLFKLNHFKQLRKEDQDKNAVKMAERIKHTVPAEIHVSIDTDKEK